jgi:hypothetical protein
MRSRTLVACAAVLALGLGVRGCGYGGTGDGEQPPDATGVTSASTTGSTLAEGSTTTEVVPATPPSTEYGYPVLTELPPLALDDVALVEIRSNGGSETPLRIVSPAADGDLVERVLAAYRMTSLSPGEGFPRWEGVDMVLRLQIRCRDEREVSIDIPVEGGRVIVGMAGEGLAVEAGAMPYAYGSAPTLADLARTLLSEDSPSGFGAGEASLPEDMPGDFGFVLAYGVTARNVLDTFAGTFTKDLVVDPSVTTDLGFSSGELERLYRRMVEIDIVDYPRDFRPDSDPTGTGTSVLCARS